MITYFSQHSSGQVTVENILMNYCVCIDTIILALLSYMFVTITAINTRSDSWILDGSDFVPSITGVETVSTTVYVSHNSSMFSNTRSDSWILEEGSFVPSITGVETVSANDLAVEVHWTVLAIIPIKPKFVFFTYIILIFYTFLQITKLHMTFTLDMKLEKHMF